jgi:coenzyme F420-0:L-glutamate ligase/coenzyme F420-1:gamma-L-glutamate ligase
VQSAIIIPELLSGRRTVRFYKPDPVPDDLVRALLEAAAQAPSAHNAQSTRYVVLRSAEAKRKLAEAMGRRWRRDLERSGTPENAIRVELRFSTRRFSGAPALVLVGCTMADMDAYPDRARRGAEQTMAVQSAAAGIQNLLLAAAANGLGACWCCAPLFCPGIVRRALGLPRDFLPQALITIGFPAHTPPAPPRKPLDEIAAYR